MEWIGAEWIEAVAKVAVFVGIAWAIAWAAVGTARANRCTCQDATEDDPYAQTDCTGDE